MNHSVFYGAESRRLLGEDLQLARFPPDLPLHSKSLTLRPGGVFRYAEDNLDEIRRTVEGEIRDTVWQGMEDAILENKRSQKPSLARINELIRISVHEDVIGIDCESFPLAGLPYAMAREMGAKLVLDGEKAFRDHPSSDNYAIWYGQQGIAAELDIDEFQQLAEYRDAGPDKIHVVVPGDWLSKLAERYYGHKNLWDFIYEENGMQHHPDRLTPGQQIRIPMKVYPKPGTGPVR